MFPRLCSATLLFFLIFLLLAVLELRSSAMPTPTAAYTIEFTAHSNYLYAHLKAETISDVIIRGYVAEMVAKSNETGLRRILLVRDIPKILSQGEVFHSVSESLEQLRGKRLALVNPHSDIDQTLDFGMTVARNRGGQYASFNNVEDAEAWLLK